ncbi:MAG: response regulator [Bacteroidota bacterium]
MIQIEEGKIVLDENACDLKTEITELLSVLEIRLKEKREHITLQLKIDRDIPQLLIYDSLRLKHVLMNLINNSINFTKRSHIAVGVTVSEKNDREAVLSFNVKYTGIGISKEDRVRISEKFLRTNQVHIEGSGPGLSIAKSLIEKMGSQLYFNSQYGEGTSFFFDLTMKVANEDQPVPPTAEGVGSIAVLVAEDNDINRMVIKKMLQNIGYEDVTYVENGLLAVEQVKTRQYDLILMDINMPVMNGVQATTQITNLYNSSDIPMMPKVVALTANAFKHEIETYLALGMSETILKPFTQAELKKSLEAVLKAENPPAGQMK